MIIGNWNLQWHTNYKRAHHSKNKDYILDEKTVSYFGLPKSNIISLIIEKVYSKSTHFSGFTNYAILISSVIA